ncbi:hypothetical protein MLD38_037596 [Melastoma candidum]|uniref:Uncharacterized protein n=1 Tax=Melastoma candidum TaxID=119954 RepID=A0ACB9LMS6_9MYRT|nr:hypothetical protein MLD38_037596 [Melastoma candidum]
MGAAASEVAISRLIAKYLELKPQSDVLSHKLQARLDEAHCILEDMLAICSSTSSGLPMADKALICASELEDTMDMFLVKTLMAPRSRRGRLASLGPRVVDLVKLWIRARGKQANAQIYITKVEELSRHFSNMQGVKLQGSSKGIGCSKHLSSPDVHSDESIIVGREYAADRLSAWLTDLELLQVISITGDRGIGKTVLVRSMYNQPHVERDFKCRAWIDSYNSPSLETVLVGQLDPENSRKLLSERSLINDEGLINKILGECSGSPPKILLFRGLSAAFEDNGPDTSPMAWHRNLKEDWWQQDVRSLSYGALPTWVKPCFIYLCLFPKDYEISTRRIFQLWHAEGLVHLDGHFTAEACLRELANRNLVQVVRRREVDGWPKTCRVSGYLHDYSEFASKFGHIHDLQNDNKEVLWRSHPTSVLPCWLARYSSNNMSLPPQDAKTASHIRSYVSFNTYKSGERSREVEQVLAANQVIILLRVLDLEGVYKPKLPKQFGYLLPNLRYLGLRSTILDSLPESVSELSRLETIDLKYTNLTELPSSILGLKYLRHLYLNEGSFDKRNQTELCLESLQTLCGLSIEAKGVSLTMLGRLEGLKKLGLTCHGPVIEEEMKTITTMTKLESLQLRSRDMFGQPSYLNLVKEMREMQSISKMYLIGLLKEESLLCLPKNLRVLTLSFSEMGFDQMDSLGALSDLVTLRLFGNSYIGEGLVFKKGAFPSLRVLKLWKLKKLKKLWIQEGTMSTLQELDMRDCTEVRKITGLENVPELKRIKLTRVNEDFAKWVESNPPSHATIVICRDLAVSSPKDMKEVKEEHEYEDRSQAKNW